MNKIITIAMIFGLGTTGALAADFTVSSPDFEGKIGQPHYANVFGCTGDNLSPAINWTGAPEGTKSFVVSIYDKDAPTGSGFWHWVVVDIPAAETGLVQGAGSAPFDLPSGARQTITDVGVPGYAGICPPPGQTHDYVITVKALGVEKLQVEDGAPGALVGLLSNMNVLAVASYTAKGGE